MNSAPSSASATESIATALRPYSRPKLVFHGKIHDLTRNASKGTNEANNNGTPNCNGTLKANPSGCSPSDVRLKQNIRAFGQHSALLKSYLYEYRPEFQATCGTGTYLGVMAQDVATVYPDAVVQMDNGYLAVDYARLARLATQ